MLSKTIQIPETTLNKSKETGWKQIKKSHLVPLVEFACMFFYLSTIDSVNPCMHFNFPQKTDSYEIK